MNRRSFISLLMIFSILLSLCPQITYARTEPIVVVKDYDYNAYEEDVVHYSVDVLNVSEDDKIEYQWFFTLNSLSGEALFPGDKISMYQWYVKWHYVSEFTQANCGPDSRKELGTKSEFSWKASEDDTCRDTDSQWAFVCRVTVNGKNYDSPVFTTTILNRDYLTDIYLTINENDIQPGKASDLVEVENLTEHMKLEGVSWQKLSLGRWTDISEGEPFEEGSYRAAINLSVLDDYRFKYTPNAYVNNESVNVLAKHGTKDKEIVVYKTYYINENFNTSATFTPYASQFTYGNVFRVKEDTVIYLDSVSTGNTLNISRGSLVVLQEDGFKEDYYLVFDSFNHREGYIQADMLEFYGYGDGKYHYDVKQNYVVTHPADVVGGSVYGDKIGTLPAGVVVTATDSFGYFVKINYNGQDGWVFAWWLAPTENPATDISYLFDTQGFYRVNVTSANIREHIYEESERVGGLKQDDIIYVVGFSDEYAGFYYGGHMCFVKKEALEKLPEEDIRDIDPVVTKSPENAGADENGSVTFTAEAGSKAYADKAYQYNGVTSYAPFTYNWSFDIPIVTIEEKGWGKVSFSEDYSSVTISECTKELDGMEVYCQIKGFSVVNTEKAVLSVNYDEEENDETEVDKITIAGTNSSVHIVKKSMDVALSGEHAEDVELYTEGVNEDGSVSLKLAPKKGVKLGMDSNLPDIKLDIDNFTLGDYSFDENGLINITLLPKITEEASASDETLNIKSETINAKEQSEISGAFSITNETGIDATITVVNGELPEGVKLLENGLSGTPVLGSGGVYEITVAAAVPAQYETKIDKVPVYKTVTDYTTMRVENEVPSQHTYTVSFKMDPSVSVIYVRDVDAESPSTWIEVYPMNATARVHYFSDKEEIFDLNIVGLEGDFDRGFTGYVIFSTIGFHYEEVAVGTHEELDHYDDVAVNVETAPAKSAQAVITIVVESGHVHEFAEKSFTPAGCASEGEIIYECECGEFFKTELAVGEHVFTPWTIEAPDDGSYKRVRYCNGCELFEEVAFEGCEHKDFNMDLFCDYCHKDMSSIALSNVTGILLSEIEEGKDLSDWSDDMDFVAEGSPHITEPVVPETESQTITQDTSQSENEETQSHAEPVIINPETSQTDENKKQTGYTLNIIFVIVFIIIFFAIIIVCVLVAKRSGDEEEKKKE